MINRSIYLVSVVLSDSRFWILMIINRKKIPNSINKLIIAHTAGWVGVFQRRLLILTAATVSVAMEYSPDRSYWSITLLRSCLWWAQCYIRMPDTTKILQRRSREEAFLLSLAPFFQFSSYFLWTIYLYQLLSNHYFFFHHLTDQRTVHWGV